MRLVSKAGAILCGTLGRYKKYTTVVALRRML